MSRAATRVLIGLVLIVALVVAAELIARGVIKHRIASMMREQMQGGSISVDLGSTPALLDLARGRIDTVSVEASRVQVSDLPDVSLDATLRDLSLHAPHHVDATDAEVTLGRTTLDTLASDVAGVQGISVQSSPGQNTLTVSALSPGVVDLVAEPKLDGDDLKLVPRSVKLLGFDLSGTKLGDYIEQHRAVQPLDGLPLSLSPQSVDVTGDGLVLTFHGGPSDLDDQTGTPGTSAAP